MGLIALLGLFLQTLSIDKNTKRILIFLGIFILIALSIRTMVRNTNWQNQSMILSHDVQAEPNDYLLELVYSTDLIEKNNINEALPHVNRALSLYTGSWLAWNNMGAIYYTRHDFVNAKKAYLHSISIQKSFGAYENLGLLVKDHETTKSAHIFLKQATSVFPTSQKLWYYRFIVAYKMKDYDDALLSAKYNFLLRRDEQSYAIYQHVLQKLPINIE